MLVFPPAKMLTELPAAENCQMYRERNNGGENDCVLFPTEGFASDVRHAHKMPQRILSGNRLNEPPRILANGADSAGRSLVFDFNRCRKIIGHVVGQLPIVIPRRVAEIEM